jgi:hypothetical protein
MIGLHRKINGDRPDAMGKIVAVDAAKDRKLATKFLVIPMLAFVIGCLRGEEQLAVSV